MDSHQNLQIKERHLHRELNLAAVFFSVLFVFVSNVMTLRYDHIKMINGNSKESSCKFQMKFNTRRKFNSTHYTYLLMYTFILSLIQVLVGKFS